MRWHKPTGTLLTLSPALWSVAMATPDTNLHPDLRTMAIFTAGAIAARGMGCTINDLLDREYDRKVERTKMRPIACGDIKAKEALVYLAAQSTIGLYILCLNNLAVIKLGLFSGVMIATYPLFKRFTYWPQVMLGLTFNWGVLMGYAAIKGGIFYSDLGAVIPLYLGANLWTLYYDTIYAHQDKADDKFVGVKSSALKLGDNTKKFLYMMSGSMFLNLALAGLTTNQLWPYFASISITGLFHARQIQNLDLDNVEDCWRAFDQQKYIGALILCGAIASVALKSKVKRAGDHDNES